MKQRFLRGLGGLGGGEQVGEHVRNCGDDRQYDQGHRESSGISHRVTSSDDSRHGHSDYQQCHRQAEHAANRCFQQQTVRAGHVWLVLRRSARLQQRSSRQSALPALR